MPLWLKNFLDNRIYPLFNERKDVNKRKQNEEHLLAEDLDEEVIYQ